MRSKNSLMRGMPTSCWLPSLFLPQAFGFCRVLIFSFERQPVSALPSCLWIIRVLSSPPWPPRLSLPRYLCWSARLRQHSNLLRNTQLPPASRPLPPPATLKVFRSLAASPSASGQLPVLFVASLRLRDGAPTQSFQYQCLTAQGGVGGERGAGR